MEYNNRNCWDTRNMTKLEKLFWKNGKKQPSMSTTSTVTDVGDNDT